MYEEIRRRKKRKFNNIGIIVCTIVGGICIVALCCRLLLYNDNEGVIKSDNLTSTEVSLLNDGDIIMRKGFGFVSNKIVELLDESRPISHCGIVVKTKKGVGVIHSVSNTLSDIDGVQICSIQQFCKDSKDSSIVVVRLRDTADMPAEKIASEAKIYLNRKVQFDNSFDLSDSSRMYCSEIVWKILLDNYNLDIYPNKNDIFTLGFAPFFDTTNFAVVIDHFE